MENTKTMPSAMPMDPPMPPTNPPAKKKESRLVEFVGGLTVASTMVSALALWYIFADQLFSQIKV